MDPNHPGGQSIHFCITLAIHKDAYTWLISCQVRTAPLYLDLPLESKTRFCLQQLDICA